MGATFVTLATTSTYGLKCTTDADCNVAKSDFNGLAYAAATTDAEKAKRCCWRYEVSKLASGDNKTTGEADLLLAKTYYGVPNTINNYSLYC